jgi:hypothetical protein
MNVFGRRSWYTLLFLLSITVSLDAQRSKHVVIAVLDGARYTETFGDSTHANIPVIWNQLRPLGTLYTSFRNDGITWTNSSHSSILNGTRDSVKNNGTQPPNSPTIFEYFRKQTGMPAEQCWVVLGKTKLRMLSYSSHAGYGRAYGAKVMTSTAEYDDIRTFENARAVLTTHHPALSIVNLAETDSLAHFMKWDGYINSIRRADLLIGLLWNVIQSDSLMRDRTTMIVLNDHGRHTSNYVDHGDHCEGCSHIMLLIVGPDTPEGVVDSSYHRQIDLAPTIGRILHFETNHAVGTAITSATGNLKRK